jgi:hypothetical protein
VRGGTICQAQLVDRRVANHDWFREHIRDVHGIDLAESFPPPVRVLDFRG